MKIGDKIKIQNGGTATILSEFGSGGQGRVFKVEYNGKEYALKWYHIDVFKDKAADFYVNLQNNIKKGAPNDHFLWPLGITEIQDGTFGYIMKVRPSGYEELTSFFVGSRKRQQVHFKSFNAIATAAINIIQAFRELHNNGYTYQDINNGNFFINPNDGNVLICDNDNVSPFGVNLGIMGKQRWMAPEVVTLQNDPDKHSDRFSLAVVLFRLLFINHPLEGKYSTPPCMTKELERKYYGSEPIFVYDPKLTQNRPVSGTDHNLKLFWRIYPQYIKDMFIRAFSQEVLLKKAPRILEKEWMDAFFRCRAEIGVCPHCGAEMFYVAGQASGCFECEKIAPKVPSLKLKSFELPMHCGMKLYLWHVDDSFENTDEVIGEVVAHPKDKRILGLKNCSSRTWNVLLPDNSNRPLPGGNVVPIKNGFQIDFLDNGKVAGTMSI